MSSSSVIIVSTRRLAPSASRLPFAGRTGYGPKAVHPHRVNPTIADNGSRVVIFPIPARLLRIGRIGRASFVS